MLSVVVVGDLKNWNSSILRSTNDKEYFYFVHSYMASPEDSADLLAYCEYEGMKITAAVRRDNITGLQFHPEKSGTAGLNIFNSVFG